MHVLSYVVQNHKFIKVTLDDFEVTLCELGASIFDIKLDHKLMTLNPSEIDFIKSNVYYGKTIGRTANRIKGNSILINQQKYLIENNEGLNTLHGGVNGISTKDFKSNVLEKNDSVEVEFIYLSKHLESGFPGNVTIKVKYIISKNNIRIDFYATSDQKTLFSLTNHNFYSLGENSNNELNLTISASKFIHPSETDLLPVEVRDVNRIMDFRKGKDYAKFLNSPYLKNSRSFGYDHYFIFDEINPKIHQIILKSHCYELDFSTDYEGTQIYTDNYPVDFPYTSSIHRFNCGIAIEPSARIDQFHYLDVDEEYRHFINLCFKRF